jgi:DNA-binding NarL/FixJ family response regulator
VPDELHDVIAMAALPLPPSLRSAFHDASVHTTTRLSHDRRFLILVLSMHRDPTIVLQALEAGALGYVLKDSATEDLLKAIEEVQRGNRYLSHSLTIEVAVSRTPPRLQSLAELTSRELDALALLAKGKTFSQIAQELKVSYKTVVNISWQLKKKLDVDNLPALVQKAMQLLPPADIFDRRRNSPICQKVPGHSRNNIHFRWAEVVRKFCRRGLMRDAGV